MWVRDYRAVFAYHKCFVERRPAVLLYRPVPILYYLLEVFCPWALCYEEAFLCIVLELCACVDRESEELHLHL